MDDAKKLFMKAFMEAERLDNADLPREDEIEWDFSKKFETSMEKLIRQNNHMQLSTRRTVSKSLLAAIVAILVLFAGLMSVTATREPIIEFVKKILPQYNDISLSKDSVPPVNTIETEYTLADLPEGFMLDTYQKDEFHVFTIWKNDAGEQLVFAQDLLDSTFTIDNEGNYQELQINGYEAYLNVYAQGSILIWTDGVYWFTINSSVSDREEILAMAENICEKN